MFTLHSNVNYSGILCNLNQLQKLYKKNLQGLQKPGRKVQGEKQRDFQETWDTNKCPALVTKQTFYNLTSLNLAGESKLDKLSQMSRGSVQWDSAPLRVGDSVYLDLDLDQDTLKFKIKKKWVEAVMKTKEDVNCGQECLP